METNFFRFIARMDIQGDLHLIITKGENGTLVVSTMVQNEKCKDKAKNLIPPFNLRGTAEQMDIGYLNKISQPMKEVSELLTNMETFSKQVEQAKKQSAMAQEATDKEKKAQEAKEKKYSDAMQKADQLEKEGKYKEAWMSVPEPTAYPDRAETLRNRREQLSAKFAPDLFATTTPKEHPNPPHGTLNFDSATDVPEEEMELEDREENDYLP